MKVISIVKQKTDKRIKLLGISIYEKNYDKAKNITEILILGGIIKGVKDSKEKKGYFMGIKIFSLKYDVLKKEINSNRNIILKNVQKMITTAFLHQRTFLEYKGIYTGKTVVLFGAGPTLKYYNPIKNAINVGVNRSFLYDKVKFDYIFAIDKLGIEEYYDDLIKYDCVKFIGNQDCGINYQIPESIVLKMNCKRYNTTANMNMPNKFTFDISTEPLCNFRSVSLQAIQFILWTNPKKIYLVGNDCTMSTQGHFIGKTYDISSRGENLVENDDHVINSWKALKEFLNTYYPETEVFSINPVGLKGVFEDVYTESYLQDNKNTTANIDSTETKHQSNIWGGGGLKYNTIRLSKKRKVLRMSKLKESVV